jgi:signal transduction histidine kinase
MIKQLRRKFILVNMLLVSLVLLVVFAIQLASAWKQTTAVTDAALQSTLLWGESGPDRWQVGGMSRPDSSPGQDVQRVATFCVVVSPTGATTLIENNVDISDETLSSALSAALSGDDDRGDLTQLGLRWQRARSGLTLRVAFADTTWERSAMLRELLTAFLVLCAALVGFFLVSLVLARLALRTTEESWKQQQQFVADASHELKTPLTVLLADVDILMAHPQDTIESQRKWVEYIQDEAHRMKELVEDMLFLARGDAAAKTALETQPTPLSDLCLNCLLSFEPVAFERGAELAEDVAPDVTVPGDPGQLRRLVAILLDNACKYCPAQGKVTLTLTKNGDRAVLTVHNTGPAIPPEALSHLFERFYRVDAARDRNSGGYGLGLSIAASIVQRHRGKISVASTDEAGTAFTVTLPAEHSA